MSRAKKILELFGSSTRVPVKQIGARNYQWDAKIDGNALTFQAQLFIGSDGMIAKITFDRKVAGKWTIKQVPSDPRLALKILTAAGNFIQTLMQEVDLSGVTFSADDTEPSRVKAYDRMARRLASSVNGRVSVRDERGPTSGTKHITYRHYIIKW